jgi:hypothetical protein
LKPRRGLVMILLVGVVGAIVVVGLFLAIRPVPLATSDVVVCRYGVVWGNTVVFLSVTGNSTVYASGTFYPEGTITSTITVTGYPTAVVDSVTTVTTQFYPPSETCIYVST